MMNYSHLFAPPHPTYGTDTSFLDSHAPVGLWEDGPVGQFESGDVYGADYFGAFDVGNKSSSKRNQAFEVLKNISTAISHPRSFSASRFRGMTRTQAASARGEVARALKSFASANQVRLNNPLDPLATYSTAEDNYSKVSAFAPQPEPVPDTTATGGGTDSGSFDTSQFYLEPVPGSDPGLFQPIADTAQSWGVPPTGAASTYAPPPPLLRRMRPPPCGRAPGCGPESWPPLESSAWGPS